MSAPERLTTTGEPWPIHIYRGISRTECGARLDGVTVTTSARDLALYPEEDRCQACVEASPYPVGEP